MTTSELFTLDSILRESGISTNNEATSELLEKYGLNWTVSKQLLSLPSGIASEFYGITRDDTQRVFATCKEGYEVFQNSELLELVNESANNIGLSVTNGGFFKQGGLVYLQLDSGTISGIGSNNDTIKKNITAINSHDGSVSLKWGTTSVTISCMNSFWQAVKSVQNGVKHTESMRDRISLVMKQIRKVQETEKNLYDTFFKFAEVPAGKKEIADAVKIALDIDLIGGRSQDLTSYQQNRLNDLAKSITREMNVKGETLWGLFSGITYYTSHLMPGGDGARMQSKAIGSGYNVDNEIYKMMVEKVS